MSLAAVIKDKRLVVCCGSGGVGKTTASAAIAVKAAAAGRKTLVITIDPAKRLAQSLGLEGLDNNERPVPPDRLKEMGPEAEGRLYAAMLDTQASMDALIRKIAKAPGQAERILSNKVYRYMSHAIAGSQEYVAMERLHELMRERDYDLVVLDTPPTKNALDFLNAPNRLAGFLDENIVKWFVPTSGSWGMGIRLFQKGSEVVFRLLGLLLGESLIQDLTDFFQSFNGLYGGFKERAEKVNDLLRDPRTVFVLVTSAERNALAEAVSFYKRLVEADIPLQAVVVNRAYQLLSDGPVDAVELVRLLDSETVHDALAGDLRLHHAARRLAGKLSDLHSLARQLNNTAGENIDRLRETLGEAAHFACVPLFAEDIHDIEGLIRMNRYLFERS